jgi:3' exoribonuclease, RNase T-like
MSRRENKPAPTKFFLDTEFIESGPSVPLILLSLGIVCEDGREFYAVNANAPLELANDWVKKNVIPHLGSKSSCSIGTFPKAILDFIGDAKPEFWGYYADLGSVLSNFRHNDQSAEGLADVLSRHPTVCG